MNSYWSFFIIENSEYLAWASYQSDTASDFLGIVHYAIVTENWIIDVLSWGEPTVEFIQL